MPNKLNFCTEMKSNPEDGSIFLDPTTYSLYMSENKKWTKILWSDKETMRKEFNEERKKKLNKLNESTQ